MIELKKGNILVSRCIASEPIGDNDVFASFEDVKGTKYPMQVNIIDESTFDIILDLSEIRTGEVSFDIRIGNASSDTVKFKIKEAIS